MADFVQSANVNSAVRKLAAPIEDIATFNTFVQSVITSNPFVWVAYMTASESHPRSKHNPIARYFRNRMFDKGNSSTDYFTQSAKSKP
jgi:hypothetical protein